MCIVYCKFVVVLQGSSVANKGRSFISVVDIELKDIPDIPLDVPRLQTDQLTQPSQPPTLTQSTPPPSPTNAELHYNALFLKDAHPKKTPPKVQFEETEGGPDEVTLRVLEKRAKADRYNQIIHVIHVGWSLKKEIWKVYYCV